MKKNLGLIILIVILLIIGFLITFIVISKQKIGRTEFNIKSGDVLEFADYETKVTILHIADTLCKDKKKCFDDGEVEVSLKVDFNGETSNYTLKSKHNTQERIKNSNNYIILSYKDNQIIVDIKNKTEI